MLDKVALKESMTTQDVIDIMNDLGSHYIILNDVPVFETICHNHVGCGSYKLYYYDNTKLFKCYTGCQDAFDIFEVIVRAKSRETNTEWTLDQAIQWYSQRSGFTFFSTRKDDDDFSIMNSYDNLTKDYKKPEIKEYNTPILNHLPFIPVADWMNEGISVETQKRYGVKFYPTRSVVVFPHNDAEGRLIGIRQRTMAADEIAIYGKYRPATISGTLYSHPLGFNLFGLDKNIENIRRTRKAVVFESEKSVMMMDSFLGSEKNIGVACCGSSFSMHQFKLLESLGVEEIIMAFDKEYTVVGDEGFNHQVKNLTKIHDKFNSIVTISFMFDKKGLLGLKDSPIDKGIETFIQLYNDRFTLKEEEDEI